LLRMLDRRLSNHEDNLMKISGRATPGHPTSGERVAIY
jgi:hypothetical protein